MNKKNEETLHDGQKSRIAIFTKYFSEQEFLKKISLFSKETGGEILETSAQLYLSMLDKKTPNWVKALIIGTLGYFIFPLDTVPDFIPLLGYLDDLSIIIFTINKISSYITDETKLKSKKFVSDLVNKKE